MRKALRKYLFVAAICLCTALTMAPAHAKAAGKVKNPATETGENLYKI